MNAQSRILVLVLAGATGTGKSAAALAAAEAFGGAVINADSRQAYADFPIITAQPSRAEQAAIPHRLYGFLPCAEKLSAGKYAELAAAAIRETHDAGLVPIVTGGTGLYLNTLLGGIAAIPPVPEAVSRAWQERCKNEGPQVLHALLRERDPLSAARLHPNDSQRITRALEVLEATGKPLGYWHELPVTPGPFNALRVCLEMGLEELTPRLKSRIEAMIENGAEEEAREALARCPDPVAPGWSGIGCAELHAYLSGRMDFATCKAQWLQHTRDYAKRQITWFKRDTKMLRLRPGDAHSLLAACAKHLGR